MTDWLFASIASLPLACVHPRSIRYSRDITRSRFVGITHRHYLDKSKRSKCFFLVLLFFLSRSHLFALARTYPMPLSNMSSHTRNIAWHIRSEPGFVCYRYQEKFKGFTEVECGRRVSVNPPLFSLLLHRITLTFCAYRSEKKYKNTFGIAAFIGLWYVKFPPLLLN